MATPRKANPQKGGRPTKYKPTYPDLLVKHMRSGYNFKSFGARCDPVATEATLWRWIEKFPAFREAKKQGEVLLEAWGIQESLRMARGEFTVVVKSTPILDAQGRPVMDPKDPTRVLCVEERAPAKVNAAALIFMLKNVLHWRDMKDVQVAGTPGGEPIKHDRREISSEDRIKEIERLRAMREKCGRD